MFFSSMFPFWVFVFEEVETNDTHKLMFIVFMCSQIVFIAEGFYTSTTLVSVTLVIKKHHLMTVETLFLVFLASWVYASSHWCSGGIKSPQHTQGSSLGAPFTGDSFRGEPSGVDLRISVSCDLPLWIFSPCSVLKVLSQWLHLKQTSSWDLLSSEVSLSGLDFFFKNSSFLFRFLLIWDGLSFFFFLSTSLGVVSLEAKEKEKLPSLIESLNEGPWLLSAWLNSRHLDNRSTSLAVIFTGEGDIREVNRLAWCLWNHLPFPSELWKWTGAGFGTTVQVDR